MPGEWVTIAPNHTTHLFQIQLVLQFLYTIEIFYLQSFIYCIIWFTKVRKLGCRRTEWTLVISTFSLLYNFSTLARENGFPFHRPSKKKRSTVVILTMSTMSKYGRRGSSDTKLHCCANTICSFFGFCLFEQ